MKTIIRRNRKIIGFVEKKKDGTYWYSYGKPSQNNFIAFKCNSLESGITNVEMPTYNR